MNQRHKLEKHQQLEVVKLYENGMTMPEIVKELNIPRTTISRTLVKFNIRIRTQSESMNIKRKLVFDKDKEIIKLYEDGNSGPEIGKIINKKGSFVQYRLRANKIKLRNPGYYHRIYHLNHEFFEKIDTFNKAMILGFFYADGNVIENTARIRIHTDDYNFLEEIRKELNSTKEIFNVFDKKYQKNYICLAFYSSKLTKDLEVNGCMPNKTFKIRFPFWMDKKFWPAFICGYYFGDGSSVWSKSGKGKKLKCTFEIASNVEFIYDLNSVIYQELGINCTIDHSRVNAKSAALSIGGPFNVLKIMDWLYKDNFIRMERKYKMFQELVNSDKEKYTKYLEELKIS